MKNECDIVGDLLFSYNDGVLSKTSNDLVKEHIKTCEDCSKKLESIKQDQVENSNNEIKEFDFLKKVNKRINKKNVIIIVAILVLLCIIIFNIKVFNNYKYQTSLMKIYLKDDITIEQIENIKNRLSSNDENIEIEYISKEKELENMEKKIKDKNNDTSSLLTQYKDNNPFPASIEIKTTSNVQELSRRVENMDGIQKIVTHLNENPYELYFINKIH